MGRKTKKREQHVSRPAKRQPATPAIGGELIALTIAALAVGLRILVVWQLSNGDPGFYHPDIDSKWHYLWAKAIASGDWLSRDYGVFYRAPLYPYLLGIWISIFGDGLWLIRIVQAIAGGVSVYLMFRLGRAAFGKTTGLVSAAVWAIWGPAIYYGYELLIPVLIIPLNLWIFERVIVLTQRREVGLGHWLLCGVIFGLSAVARPNILIVAPLILGWVFIYHNSRRQYQKRVLPLAALVAGTLLAILPVTVRNAIVGGDPVLIAYQGGVNFYLGNNAVADGLSMRMPEVLLDERITWNEFVDVTDSVASRLAQRPLSPSEISSFWLDRGLEFIRRNFTFSFKLWMKKLYYTFNGFENGDATNLYRFAGQSSVLSVLIWNKLVFFPFGLVAPLAIVGMIRSWRQNSAGRFLSLSVLFYLPTVIGFLVTARHRLVLVPILIIFAVVAVNQFIHDVRNRKLAISAITGGVTVVILLYVLNLPAVARIMINPGFDHYQKALAMDRLGRYQDAIESYREALRYRDDNIPARKNLALDLFRVGNFNESIHENNQALKMSPDDAELMNNMGLAFRARGDTDFALTCFSSANETNPRLAAPYYNTAEIAEARQDTGLARRGYRNAITSDRSYGPAYNALGRSFAQDREFDSALSYFERCRDNAPDYTPCLGNLGAVLLDLGRPAEAIEPLEHYLEAEPGVIDIMFNLSVAYVRTDQLQKATLQLQAILRNYPDYRPARELLEQIQSATAPVRRLPSGNP